MVMILKLWRHLHSLARLLSNFQHRGLIIPLGLILIATMAGGCKNTAAPPASDDPIVNQGAQLISGSCLGCHSLDGKKQSGPTFKGLAGSQVQLADGRTITADDAYLAKAITDPDAEVTKGFSKGVMSSVLGNGKKFSPEQINAMVAYIKTVK